MSRRYREKSIERITKQQEKNIPVMTKEPVFLPGQERSYAYALSAAAAFVILTTILTPRSGGSLPEMATAIIIPAISLVIFWFVLDYAEKRRIAT